MLRNLLTVSKRTASGKIHFPFNAWHFRSFFQKDQHVSTSDYTPAQPLRRKGQGLIKDVQQRLVPQVI
jgi:hypothetical protein